MSIEITEIPDNCTSSNIRRKTQASENRTTSSSRAMSAMPWTTSSRWERRNRIASGSSEGARRAQAQVGPGGAAPSGRQTNFLGVCRRRAGLHDRKEPGAEAHNAGS